MNGRIYDPLIGRFMSADPYIQAPDDLQSFNRYAYVRNNPLNLTDPSGYKWWVKFREKFLKPAIAKFLDVYCGGCATILLNAYNAYWTKDANGHRLGWKGAAFSFGLTLIGGISDNPIYQAGVNMLSGCGMSAMAGGSCKKGAVDALTNEIGGPIIGGCLNARRAGGSCAVGAREGLTSMAGDYLAGRAADKGHDYIKNNDNIGANYLSGEDKKQSDQNDKIKDREILLKQTDINYPLALTTYPENGEFLIVAHGNQNLQTLAGMTPTQSAEFIRQTEWMPGQTIRLDACWMGMSQSGHAQQLSNILNVTVIASPTLTVGVNGKSNPWYSVNIPGTVRTIPLFPALWKEFNPQK